MRFFVKKVIVFCFEVFNSFSIVLYFLSRLWSVEDVFQIARKRRRRRRLPSKSVYHLHIFWLTHLSNKMNFCGFSGKWYLTVRDSYKNKSKRFSSYDWTFTLNAFLAGAIFTFVLNFYTFPKSETCFGFPNFFTFPVTMRSLN
jgi:hypothetical protein